FQHSWFAKCDHQVTYLLAEMRSETDYTVHHIQKITAFFEAMNAFAGQLSKMGHRVLHLHLDHQDNRGNFLDTISHLVDKHQFQKFEYLLPDEYRLDVELNSISEKIHI